MTKGVGFDKFWDEGGGEHRPLKDQCVDCADIVPPAITPNEAAKSLISFIDEFDISKTGQLWAPRGPG